MQLIAHIDSLSPQGGTEFWDPRVAGQIERVSGSLWILSPQLSWVLGRELLSPHSASATSLPSSQPCNSKSSKSNLLTHYAWSWKLVAQQGGKSLTHFARRITFVYVYTTHEGLPQSPVSASPTSGQHLGRRSSLWQCQVTSDMGSQHPWPNVKNPLRLRRANVTSIYWSCNAKSACFESLWGWSYLALF